MWPSRDAERSCNICAYIMEKLGYQGSIRPNQLIRQMNECLPKMRRHCLTAVIPQNTNRIIISLQSWVRPSLNTSRNLGWRCASSSWPALYRNCSILLLAICRKRFTQIITHYYLVNGLLTLLSQSFVWPPGHCNQKRAPSCFSYRVIPSACK